ncbi:hypothetical protein [Streptomyces goshikiensis]|uniref:hypothetical protein n=1 Tax=Streptomyces goshikiensis TaxID=1942 RepID=UPI0022F3A6BE|nr:hypothetical protein [Streptomyces goshikiensis]WBY25019.1 hypothetical protein PET44_35940 [Streptomyces goshikiensis]
MRTLETQLQALLAKAEHFFSAPDPEWIYFRCASASLGQPDSARLLGKREGVNRSTVLERMRAEPYRGQVIDQCADALRTRFRFERACARLAEAASAHEHAVGEAVWGWRPVCVLLTGGLLVLILFGGPLIPPVLLLLTAGVLTWLHSRGSTAWLNLRQCMRAGALKFGWLVHRVNAGACAMAWAETLQREGTGPAAGALIREMLGEDPDSLLIRGGHEEGLRTPRGSRYLVDNAALLQLKRKVQQIEGGTIAVCGPRGSGKTTLLETAVRAADFGVLAQAPASYTPHDFLVSLSVRLCQTYIRDSGKPVPEFTRLSPLDRLGRRVKAGAKRVGRWALFAVPAAALVVLGSAASVRAVYRDNLAAGAHLASVVSSRVSHGGIQMWQGHSVASSVLVTLVGLLWWRGRRRAGVVSVLLQVPLVVAGVTGFLLFAVLVRDLVTDKQILLQLQQVEISSVLILGVLYLLWESSRTLQESEDEFSIGFWEISARAVFRPATYVVGGLLVVLLLRNDQVQALLADSENPLRLAGFVVAALLFKVALWKPRPAESALVVRCQDYLYRLQTVQSSSNALTTGIAQILSLGTAQTSSLSTVPVSFPELVDDFRRLLGLIAMEKTKKGEVVVIAVDEVDRLGSDTQALAFLSEIKAILGVPDVYYLISVAEDVGAAFVRRGLPHRDVTDSSLDDILHVQPSTLEESREILSSRSETLTGPYTALAHALSGGGLRDLLRYGLQILEMQEKSQSNELTEISRHLILEELSETLAGFRTLLSKHQFSRSTSTILGSFGALVRDLQLPCPCAGVSLRPSLERFAFYGAAGHPGTIADPDLVDTTRQLIEEASAYAYFSLTLLDIFSSSGLDRRTGLAAAFGREGDLQRLADARQELGISPYSARTLLDGIRVAWTLSLQPRNNGDLPLQRASDCSIHTA